jgi:AcrR family transcriptional regulator
MRKALAEFSRAGYAGARVDRIAVKAGVSKGMIYYHFRTKDELFAAVLESAWDGGHVLTAAPDHPVESILFWSEFYQKNREWSRLLGWEGLEWRKRTPIMENERLAFWRSAVEKMKKYPKGPEFLDLEQFLISLIAIEIAPILLPQICKMITGKDPSSPTFCRERARFLRSFAQAFANAQRP